MRFGLRFARLRCTPCGKVCPSVQVRGVNRNAKGRKRDIFAQFAAWPFFQKGSVPDSKLSCTRLDAVL
jgi:hypothetical protein